MKAQVTINSGSDDKVRISFVDVLSGIEFAEVTMEPAVFGRVITGLAFQEAELEVRGLENVGKQRVTEARRILCPLKSYSRTVLQEWLKNNAQEEGWKLSTYLGSQNSITCTENGTWLRYSVTKYEEVTE